VLPYELSDADSVDETLRLKWRAYDLRGDKLQQAIRTRSQVTSLIRRHLEDGGFLELETPQLTRATTGGAREFLVPSYQHDQAVFALPQSPQVYKQLYMCGGFEKYYQIVRCFRDEAARSDRQPEFTQIDIEAAFYKATDIQRLIESLVSSIWQRYGEDALPAAATFLLAISRQVDP
jgi:aspartyl-tRNA synthetase